MYEQIVEEILKGRRLCRGDDLTFLLSGELASLRQGANWIREKLCGSHVSLCSIINGRAGQCSENCRFCAQSSHYHTGIEKYEVPDAEEFIRACRQHQDSGVHRFSIVTAGRTLEGEDFDQILTAYRRMATECGRIKLCASHGLLGGGQFAALREAGVSRYHANIETSRRHFPKICTTHTFEDKLACIRAAKEAGLQICSGGIIGMGETWEDRLDMALTLSELQVDSIPLNVLIPIPGTPFEELPVLSEDEILRTVVIFRFLNPVAEVRLAAGRIRMRENGKDAFLSGANGTITGDMLTTSGNQTAQDIAMLRSSGFVL